MRDPHRRRVKRAPLPSLPSPDRAKVHTERYEGSSEHHRGGSASCFRGPCIFDLCQKDGWAGAAGSTPALGRRARVGLGLASPPRSTAPPLHSSQPEWLHGQPDRIARKGPEDGTESSARRHRCQQAMAGCGIVAADSSDWRAQRCRRPCQAGRLARPTRRRTGRRGGLGRLRGGRHRRLGHAWPGAGALQRPPHPPVRSSQGAVGQKRPCRWRLSPRPPPCWSRRYRPCVSANSTR